MADRANWCCWPASVVFTHTLVILLTTPHHNPLINCWWPADGAVSNTENIFLLPDWNSAALNSSDYSDRRYCAGWCIIASCNIQPYPQWPRLRRVGRLILQRVYHYCATWSRLTSSTMWVTTVQTMLSVTHIMQQSKIKCTNSANNKQFKATFPWQDFSPTFSKIPDIPLTAVKFPDISRFSGQVVTLCTISLLYSVMDGKSEMSLVEMPLHDRRR